ncbi:pentatricopeptide repeat-containing protein At4g04790, mitochondrial-like isoform X2 [Aristolochia californica]|uniref:pentatricopeptide repeat-containing protein At4g04790, mitochondrial-like isoform X2 n=1 Tax=Aristolochia californica TaxID=171875 RepID=UPI0035D5DF78
MPAKKLTALSSVFASATKKDLKKPNAAAASEILSITKLFSSPDSPTSAEQSSRTSKRAAKELRRGLSESETSSLSSEKSSLVTDGPGRSPSQILKEISSILCRTHISESSSLPSSELPICGKPSDDVSDNVLDIPWFSAVSPTSVSQRRKQLSRERKQKWIFKNTQNRRFERLVRMCAQKLGTDATIDIFGKLGRETGVKEYNALIKVCIEKARGSPDEEESLDQIYKAFQLFKSMKEKGFPLEEETYDPFLIYLVDMSMEQEFHLFKELIQDVKADYISRLGYYEMLLWIHVKNEDKISELCSSINVGGEDQCYGVAENYLLAFCERDREKDILKMLEMVDVTKMSSTKYIANVFKSMGRLLLEDHAEDLIMALKKSEPAAEDISSFIFEYASNIPNLVVEEVISKVKYLHEKLEVESSAAAYENLIMYCCSLLKVHAALDVVDLMCQSGLALSADTFNPILCASEKSCDIDLVRPIYSVMRRHNLMPKGETIKNMICLHVKMKDFEGAYNMLKDLEEMDVKPTPNMYNAIMAGYFREKNIYGGLMVLKQMERAKVQPDSETFSYLLCNCENEDDINKYMEDIKRAGVLVTKHIYMALVNAYANIGKFEKAKQVLLDPEIPIKSINEIKSALTSALAFNGEILCALKIYEEVKQTGCQLEPKAIISLIEYLRSEGQLDKLLELLEGLKDSGYWFDGCSRVVLYCVRYKHLSCTVDLLKQLKEKDESSTGSVFDMIFAEILEREPIDLDIALSLLQIMKDELKLQPSRTSLDFLLSACASAKDPHRAWQVWGEYGKACLPMNILTYLRLYQVMLVSGERKSASDILRKISRDDPHVRCIVKACQTTFSESTVKKRENKQAIKA